MAIPAAEVVKKVRIRNCPDCKSTNLVEYQELECTVCMDCGFVISPKTAKPCPYGKRKANLPEQIRSTSWWENPTQLVEKKKSIPENIAFVLGKWKDVKIADSTEKNLALALQSITEIAIDLSLSMTTLEKASLIYKKIIEKELLKGRSMKVMTAVAVYVGCKQCGKALTMKDIAHASGISSKRISRSFRSIIRQLDVPIKLTGVDDHASRLSAQLQLPMQATEIAEKIVKALDGSKFLIGKDPAGIAGAAIYISSLLTGKRRTQREVAEAGRITEATIRTRCRELEKNLVFNISL